MRPSHPLLSALILVASCSAGFSVTVNGNPKLGSLFPASGASPKVSSSGVLAFQASAQRRMYQRVVPPSVQNGDMVLRKRTADKSLDTGHLTAARPTAMQASSSHEARRTEGLGTLGRAASLVRKTALNVLILGTILLLELIDLVLNVVAVLSTLAKAALMVPLRFLGYRAREAKLRAVIVGASFAGLAVARGLRKEFAVTLIDRRDYFEYTPGVLRLFVRPDYFSALTARLKSKRGVRFMQGSVTSVQQDAVSVQVPGEAGPTTQIEYDVLVLACGSSYGSQGLKHGERGWEARGAWWAEQAKAIEGARRLLVVGAGPVGVELAAEVAAAYPDKEVTLAGSSAELCDGFAVQASKDFSRAWMQDHGVRLALGGRCEQEARPTEQGEEEAAGTGGLFRCGVNGSVAVEADHVMWCVGGKPSTDFLRGGAVAGAVGRGGVIRVRGSLLVEGSDRVFALGDAVEVAGGEPHAKLGHTAEVQARVLCSNVRRVMLPPEGSAEFVGSGPRLVEFVGSAEHSMYALSLGKYHASVRLGPLVTSGFVGAYLKWAIEWTKVAQAAGRSVGELCWTLADFITARTVDRMAEVEPRDDKGDDRRKSRAETR